MKTFKDFLNEDLNVFFNLGEFAEMHNIDGEEMPAIVDSELTQILSNRKEERFDGVYSAEIALFVKVEDMPEKPVYGQQMRVDDELYLVKESYVDEGVRKIILEANES